MVFNTAIRYCDGELVVDDIKVASIVGETGTPTYVYSLSRATQNYRRLKAAFSPLKARIHYSVKANGNLALLRALGCEGAGFDCVSGGEIYRVLRAGGRADDIVFAGVGKTRDEIAYGLESGVGWFNVENLAELEYINRAACERDLESVPVALRLNPELKANTHPYIATGHGGAKFGLTADVICDVWDRQSKYPLVDFAGIHVHIGSQLGDMEATSAALERVFDLIRLNPQITTINLGGGLPVAYRFGEEIPSIQAFVDALALRLEGYALLLEPGRSIVADAGILVAEVLYVKRQAGQLFYIVDASMTELIRPALYGAHHEIVPLCQADAGEEELAHVVGPVCESADVLARQRRLPPLQVGDRVAIMTAGAYGMAMASNYNARPRPAEVVVGQEGARWWLSRRRETKSDLLRGEIQNAAGVKKDPRSGPYADGKI